MYNPQLFESRAALLNTFLTLDDLEGRRLECAASQDYQLMKSLTMVLDELGADTKNLVDGHRKLEAELNVESVFGELGEFILPRTEPDFCNSDVFQRILDGINEFVDSEIEELSQRKDRENYFELLAIQQKIKKRFPGDAK